MRTIAKNRPATDDYLKLVRAFPLRPIRHANEYEAAGKVLNRLLGHPGGPLTLGQRDYLEALVVLVEDYDRKHSAFVPANRTPAQRLKYLADQAGMGAPAIGAVLGTTHAAASLILDGKRSINAQAARALAEYFKVDANTFI